MKDRRAHVAVGAALFALGFAAGYAAHGRVEPRREEITSASTTPSGSVEAHAESVRTARDAGAARGADRTHDREADPASAARGGGVALIGAGEGARASSGAGSASASGEAADVPPLDGGTIPTGRLDAAAIRDVVREHRDQLGFCFAWQLHQHPELRGRLTMDFTIGEDGTVTRAEVADDQLGDETVLRCFGNVTRRMRFPSPEGGEVRVRYPFILAPEAPSADENR